MIPAGTIVFCATPVYVDILIPAWTISWALIGYAVGKWRQRPAQYLVFREPHDTRPDEECEKIRL